jgi:hypothetical protein
MALEVCWVEQETFPMPQLSVVNLLILIALAPALAFFGWVFLSMGRQLRNRRRHY